MLREFHLYNFDNLHAFAQVYSILCLELANYVGRLMHLLNFRKMGL